MDATRRHFLHSVSAAAVATSVGMKATATVARAGEGEYESAGATSASEKAGATSGTTGQAGQQSADDPLGVRADFPVVENGIYLDSPYIAPSPRQVVEAGRAFVDAKGNGPVPLGAMLEETGQVRHKFAELIGAKEPEIGVLDATSAGENLVANSLDLSAGDNVVIDDLHYETTFVLYRHLEETRGVELRILKNEDGAATPDEFAALIDNKTRLVSVSWVSHQNGYRHDLKALAELAHAHGAYLYADAIQGIGMLALDVEEVGIDFLTSGTYKWLLGGFGVAPFYVRESLLDLVKPDRLGAFSVARDLGDFRFELHKSASKFMYATPAFGAIFQLRAGLDYLLQVGVENIERHTVGLASRIHEGLTEQGYEILTPAGNSSAIVTFNHGRDHEMVALALETAGIRATVREESGQIRVGPALFNNVQEIEEFLEMTGNWM
jgi:cysteine desulfurase/selenocysteine lyase